MAEILVGSLVGSLVSELATSEFGKKALGGLFGGMGKGGAEGAGGLLGGFLDPMGAPIGEASNSALRIGGLAEEGRLPDIPETQYKDIIPPTPPIMNPDKDIFAQKQAAAQPSFLDQITGKLKIKGAPPQSSGFGAMMQGPMGQAPQGPPSAPPMGPGMVPPPIGQASGGSLQLEQLLKLLRGNL